MISPESIIQKAAGSVKWSGLMEVAARTASPLIYLILARLLTPADFGVVAVAMIALNFSQMFWDGGLGKALVQIDEAPEPAANVVFWVNAVMGLVIYAVLFLAAPGIAEFFHSPASLPVLRVLGLLLVINSLSAVQASLCARELDFRRLFWIKLATAFLPGFFSIPLAFWGYGVWALVAGYLASSLLNLGLLWRTSPWRPRWDFDWGMARRLFRFGLWVVGESLAGWFFIWGDNLLVGRFLGINALGVYSVGWNICTMIFGLALNPFLPVLYPTFSRLQGDLQALGSAFRKVNRILISLALPMGVGLLLVGPMLAHILFGDKWQGLGLVLSLIGFMNGMTWLVGINPEVYRAMGRPDVNTKLMFIAIMYYLPTYLLAAPYGLTVFTIARLGVALLAIPIHVFLCMRLLRASPFYLWHDGKPMILATVVMALGVVGAKWLLAWLTGGLPQALILITSVGTVLIAYGGMLCLLDAPFVLQTRSLLKKTAFA